MAGDAVLASVFEPTNELYSVIKTALIKMCENYNHLYGTD